MSAALPVLHIAYVTLETTTPLSLSTGANDSLFDTLLVRDANGLPIIPGTSLAGVLRHLYDDRRGRTAANALFGIDVEEIQRRAKERDRAGVDYVGGDMDAFEASLLQVTSAAIHASDDQPVASRPINLDEFDDDPILAHALAEQPLERDHVMLSHLGAAAAERRGKFTRAALARGNRFTFELALWSKDCPDTRWTELGALFGSSAFRLGGATRRGYGGVEVCRWLERVFDLHDSADAAAYRTHYHAGWPACLDGFAVRPRQALGRHDSAIVCAELLLEAEDFFRFGAGSASLGEAQGKPPDMLPLTEPCVLWKVDGTGRDHGTLSQRRVVIPASAVKGAIAHRTAYHYNCLAGRFAEDGVDGAKANPAVVALFGQVRERADGERMSGYVGRVLLSDLLLDCIDTDTQVGHMTHNGLDRFTGGTRHGVLYTEELIFEQSFELSLEILQTEAEALQPKLVRQALAEALTDLAEGRLALGAGGSKGHGYFRAPTGIKWSDGGEWISGGVS